MKTLGWKRGMGILGCVALLSIIYISQRYNYLEVLLNVLGKDVNSAHPYTYFVFNKTLRFFLNDSTMVLMIWFIWMKKEYVKLAIAVELFGLLIILPLYFVLKLTFEGDSEISSPLLSFIHRLIINPTLMILLIPALFFQEKSKV